MALDFQASNTKTAFQTTQGIEQGNVSQIFLYVKTNLTANNVKATVPVAQRPLQGMVYPRAFGG